MAVNNPHKIFKKWFADAKRTVADLPEAMALATSKNNGRPSVRMVLLKQYNNSGFVFYTHEGSRKGMELRDNPAASVVFWWPPLHRQVRIDGLIKKNSAGESDAYFATRPRESQIGAWASAQSRVIPDRKWIEKRINFFKSKFKGRAVPRPPYWLGYRLVPSHFEFWQEKKFRLHDRITYDLRKGKWVQQRLAP